MKLKKNNKSFNFVVIYFLVCSTFLFISILTIFDIITINDVLFFIIIILGVEGLVCLFLGLREDGFSPLILIPFLYMFYALGPILANKFNDNVYSTYLLYQLLGLIALKLGLYSGGFSLRNKSKLKLEKELYLEYLWDKKILYKTACVLLMIALPAIVLEIYAFGGLVNLVKIGHGGDRFQVINSAFIIGRGHEWLLLSAILFLYYGVKEKSLKNILFGICIYFSESLLLLYIGGRSTIVYTLIFAGVLFNYSIKRLSGKKLVIILIIGIVISQYYALARYFIPQGLLYSFIRTWDIVLQNPYLLYPWATNEFKYPGMSMLELIQYGTPPLLYGQTYIGVIGSIFPFLGKLFNQFSFNPSIWRLEMFYPEILADEGGLGYAPIAEGYINFRGAGVFFHMLVYGYLISLVHNLVKSKKSLLLILIYAAMLPLFLLDGLRIHASSWASKLFRAYLIVPIIFFIISLFYTKGRNNSINRN